MKYLKWTPEKIEEIRIKLTAGATLAQCADELGITRQAMYHMKKRYLPDLDRDSFGKSVASKGKTRREEQRQRNLKMYGKDSRKDLTPLDKARMKAVRYKRKNRGRHDFEIDPFEIEYPSHCPVLGIELDWFSKKATDNSPSFDRIDPSKGYVSGNVVVMSMRANRIKNDGTADEHQKIANWISATLCNAS